MCEVEFQVTARRLRSDVELVTNPFQPEIQTSFTGMLHRIHSPGCSCALRSKVPKVIETKSQVLIALLFTDDGYRNWICDVKRRKPAELGLRSHPALRTQIEDARAELRAAHLTAE